MTVLAANFKVGDRINWTTDKEITYLGEIVDILDPDYPKVLFEDGGFVNMDKLKLKLLPTPTEEICACCGAT